MPEIAVILRFSAFFLRAKKIEKAADTGEFPFGIIKADFSYRVRIAKIRFKHS